MFHGWKERVKNRFTVVNTIFQKKYQSFSTFLKSFIGKFILIGFTWSMSYHLLSGIRHFFWDLGYGYEIKTANLSGIIVIIGSLFLTIILWMIGRGLI